MRRLKLVLSIVVLVLFSLWLLSDIVYVIRHGVHSETHEIQEHLEQAEK